MGEWLFSAMFGSPGLKLTPLIIDCMIMIRIVWIANPWHLTRITNKMWKCHISTYFNYITDLFQSIICWFPCPIRGIKTVIFVDCLRLPWAMVHVQIMHLLMWPMHHCCWTLHLWHRSLHDGLQPSDLLSLLWQNLFAGGDPQLHRPATMPMLHWSCQVPALPETKSSFRT